MFAEIQRLGDVAEGEMDRVFNRGIGMALVVEPGRADDAVSTLEAAGQSAGVIGTVTDGRGVHFS